MAKSCVICVVNF